MPVAGARLPGDWPKPHTLEVRSCPCCKGRFDSTAGTGATTTDPQRTGATPGLQQGRQVLCLRRDHTGDGRISRLEIEQIRHAQLAPLRRIGSSHSISGPNVLTDLSTAGSEDKLGVLICGHGSRNRVAVEEFAGMVELLRPRLAPMPVEHGYLEFARPILRDPAQSTRIPPNPS